jgi:hypothetical protein
MRGRQARRIDLGVHRYLSRVHELIGLWLPGRRWPDRQRPLYDLPRLPANQLSPAMTNDSMHHRSLATGQEGSMKLAGRFSKFDITAST